MGLCGMVGSRGTGPPWRIAFGLLQNSQRNRHNCRNFSTENLNVAARDFIAAGPERRSRWSMVEGRGGQGEDGGTRRARSLVGQFRSQAGATGRGIVGRGGSRLEP